MTHVKNNSGYNEWYTPYHIIQAVIILFGRIDLDPATSIEANDLIRAKRIHTIDDNGLNKTWSGNVWLNPPYSRDLLPKFIDKMCLEYTSGNVGAACVLTNNATETKWFQKLASNASAILFFRKRIKFWTLYGKNEHSPLQGQVMFYLGSRPDNFYEIFSQFGFVCFFNPEGYRQ